MIQTRLLRDGADQAGAVEACTRTYNLTGRQTAQSLDQVCNNIAGIRNIYKAAVEPAGHDFGDIPGDSGNGKAHFVITAAGGAERDLTHGVDDDIAIPEFFICSRHILNPMRHEHDGIH